MNRTKKRGSREWKRNNNRPARGKNNDRKKGRIKSSTLDPALLVKTARISEEVVYKPTRLIADMPLNKELKLRLDKKGFIHPTEIQDKTLEALLGGQDLLGIAQTGTGKTGAFLMPIIEKFLQKGSSKKQALIVVPTRELAVQVTEEFRSMTKGLGLFGSCFIGGTSIGRDIQTLRRYSHLIIGTPGRLLDLKLRGALDLRNFNTLVLDEFDRMLDMGFARDMDMIINSMINRQQTMLFSATLDKSQQKRIGEILNNPLYVKISSGDTTGDQIDQDVIKLNEGEDKFDKLCAMLQQHEFSKVLLFDETKRRVDRLCQKLNRVGIKSDQIQGDKSQNARQRALRSFKEGQIRVLVATDVAARGIDVNDVSHVINYQMPTSYESYIHRIGRTGRAGKRGKAYTFVA